MSYSEPQTVYSNMVEKFKATRNKSEILKSLIDYCGNSSTTNQNVYDLKKKLEVQFSLDVGCNYSPLKTSIDYGCDLREILYDRNNQLIEGGQTLLDIFVEKKMPDMWHIMTDIDDTLYPNTEHGTYIAGSDVSWPEKNPYPGIIKFYDLFYSNLPIFARYTTVLSATPGFLKKSKLADAHHILHNILQEYGFIQGPESKTQIATHVTDFASNWAGQFRGSLTNKDVSVDTINSAYKLFGNTKFERFKQYLTIFPEYKILFFGDNGQGDVLAGKQMVEYSDRCHVFIHKVSENGTTFKKSFEEDQNIPRLNFFKNYYEAAVKLRELGVFTRDNVNDIKTQILNEIMDINKMPFTRTYYNSALFKSYGGVSSRKTMKKTTGGIKKRKSGKKTRKSGKKTKKQR